MLDHERKGFHTFIRGQGLKLTRERTVVFDEIFRHHQHFDAEELLGLLRKRHRKVSRATVYRTLELLVTAGLVSRVKLAGEQSLYEHVHPGEHHDHLVCLHCGKILEFSEEKIERLQEEICSRLGFHPRSHTHRIEGCCADCFDSSKEELADLRADPAGSAGGARRPPAKSGGSQPPHPPAQQALRAEGARRESDDSADSRLCRANSGRSPKRG
jgi:Fur family ferric uptake transcriptional regulator